MKIYRNDCRDPYYNLASEEYLLENESDSVFMLWRNSDAVIIGKNQNAYAELDVEFTEANSIKVVRRLTGGGAVFHDEGNINFTFIVPGEENATLDFARFTRPIIDAISALGVEDVTLSGRNDIMIGDKKVSGNAQSSYNGKTIHHGTLLYSADLSRLAGALKVDPEKIKAKGIKSVRNRVGNIADFLDAKLTAPEFMNYIESRVAAETGATVSELPHEYKIGIRKLADLKYSTWEWNFGKSKEYSSEKKKRYDFGTVEVKLRLDGGIIKQVKIAGDFFGVEDVSLLEESLVGLKFEKSALECGIDTALVGRCIAGMDADSLTSLLLS